MMISKKIDLHMHTTVSDGTDAPEEIIRLVSAAGIGLFSVTDHDSIKAAERVGRLLKEGDPLFVTGVEFSCRDVRGKYHILGYGYDPASDAMRALVESSHDMRMRKAERRLAALKAEFGIELPKEETEALLALDNPGKPHFGNLLVKYGYAPTKDEAIRQVINKLGVRSEYLLPGDAIEGILKSGGIPVLAHPVFGSGSQSILGDELRERVAYLTDLGLRGLEACYSGFDSELRQSVIALAKERGLYVTAGSDYHGSNKTVRLGETGLDEETALPDGMEAFLEAIRPAVIRGHNKWKLYK